MDESFYLLKYNAELVERELEGQPPEAGDAKDIENAFEVVEEFSESVSQYSHLSRSFRDVGSVTALSSTQDLDD